MFFFRKSSRLDDGIPLVQHNGIFRRQITAFEGVALIMSATIGAGIFSIPYALSKTGVLVGLIYIFGVGFLMIGLNLLVGEIAVRTKGNFQLVGLARKYLGKAGQWIMTIIIYISVAGIQVIYIIGEGKTLFAFFGGSEFFWSLIFFAFGIVLVYFGLKTIKVVEFFLSMLILAVILLIAGLSAPHIEPINFQYTELANLLFPYGVILFAYCGMSSVLEVHTILADNKKLFKKVIITAGLMTIVTYTLFTFAILGVTGRETTEIATIGLGQKLGPLIFLLGNIFSTLAMTTGFLMVGVITSDSLCWDYKLSRKTATILVGGIPLILFIAGLRQFILVMDIVGGVFLSLEMIIAVLIFWRAKQLGDLKPGKYKLHHTLLLTVVLLVALIFGAIYSIIKLF
jgi:amino acid permease